MTPAPWLSYLCLAAAMALVGIYVGLSKSLVAVFPVFLLAWLRFGIASLAMGGWLTPGAGPDRVSRHDRTLIFLQAFLGNFLFSICMLFGVAHSSALAAGVILATIPAAVALLSWTFLRERITVRVGLGIGCAVGGVALVSVVRDGVDQNRDSMLGQALLLGAVFCEASYVVIGKRLTARVSAKRISAWMNLWGLALATPLGAWQAWGYGFGAVPLSSWALLVFYSLAASVVTVWLWMTGLKQVPAASAGVFTVFLPVGTAAVGVLLLGERFNAAEGAAYALAVSGVVLASWGHPRAPRRRASQLRG